MLFCPALHKPLATISSATNNSDLHESLISDPFYFIISQGVNILDELAG